jgi:type I restriction enzyme M protein
MSDPNLSSFIWSVADLLRGDYKQSEYGRVILPFTVLRRLDCVLEPTKPAVLAELAKRQKAGLNPEPFLLQKSGQHFVNTSPLDMKTLMGDQDHAVMTGDLAKSARVERRGPLNNQDAA